MACHFVKMEQRQQKQNGKELLPLFQDARQTG